MIKPLLVAIFFGAIILSNSYLLTKCNNLKKEGAKLLTCNVYLKKNGEYFEYFFLPQNKPQKRIYISRNAEKVNWDNCEIILKEKESYMLINLDKSHFTIKRFDKLQSLDSFYYKIHGDLKKINLQYSSGTYNLLAY